MQGQPRYLRMVLPRWAAAERARQRRPVAVRPREAVKQVAPGLYHDQPDQELVDWLAKCIALGISRDRPPCSFENGTPIIERYPSVQCRLADGQIHRVEIDWSDFPAPASTVVWNWCGPTTATSSI